METPTEVKGTMALGSCPCLVKMGPAAGNAASWRRNHQLFIHQSCGLKLLHRESKMTAFLAGNC